MNSRKYSQRSVTMRDVAKLAGVSQSTVSRVLSQAESTIPISEDTYRKVYEAIKTLGYHPNATARALRTQQTNMIAVMIADISNAFYHTIARTIQDIATQNNYDVIIANTDHIHEYEKRFCEAMMRRPVDGIIMVPYHLTEHDIEQLMFRTGAAVVVLSRQITHPQVDVVSGDDTTATYNTVRWLIEKKGHRNIGYITVPNTGPGERRLAAYRQAIQAAGLPEYVDYGDWTVGSGETAMHRLRTTIPFPCAVLACNDHMAIGVLNAALDAGLSVPEEVAIVGFDNVPATTFVRPKLTTIAQHPADMGTRLANLLFDRIERGYEGSSRVYQVELDLIERDTT